MSTTLTFTVEVEVDNAGERHVPYILQMLSSKLTRVSYGTKVRYENWLTDIGHRKAEQEEYEEWINGRIDL